MAADSVAAGIDDPSRADYFKAFKGETIAFVPVTMGIDLTEAWASVMKKQADRLGMKFEIRDTNSARIAAQRQSPHSSRKSRTSLSFTIPSSSPTPSF